MANDLNKFMCIGRLGKDPEIRYMPNGNAVASFSVASSESWKDKTTGEKQERTEWVNCSAFGKLAEIIGEYVKKGSKLYIEGKMRTEKYTGNDGVEKYSTKIIVDNMQMLDSRNDSAGGQAQQGYQQPTQAQQPQQGYAPKQQPQQQYAQNPAQNVGQPQYNAQNNAQQRPAPQRQQPMNQNPPAQDGWDDGSDIPY